MVLLLYFYYFYTIFFIGFVIIRSSKRQSKRPLLVMKIAQKRSFNFTMALQWLLFLPIILPLCIIFGAVQGVVTMLEKMAVRMWMDIDLGK